MPSIHRIRGMMKLVPGAAVVAAGAIVAPVVQAADLLAVASDEQLWFVRETTGETQRIELCHHAAAMGRWVYRPHLLLSETPVALAAWDQSLWLVNQPVRGEEEPLRSVFTVQVLFNEALNVYYTEPHDRLRVVDSLPGAGRLASLVGTADGPVALLLPVRTLEPQDSIVRMPEEGRDPLTDPVLLQLRKGRWTSLPLPEDVPASAELRLSAAGPDGRRLVLLQALDEPGRTAVHARGPEGRWTREVVDLDLARVAALTRVGPHVAVMSRGEEADRLELAYLWQGRLRPVGSVRRPEWSWAVAGLSEGLRLLSLTPSGSLEMTEIDLLRATEPVTAALRLDAPASAKMWAVSLLFAITLTAVILVLFIRPSSSVVSLPSEMHALPATARLAGLAMDLVPGAVLTLLLLRCSVRELFMLPIITADIEQTVPYFVMSALTLVHTTTSEVLTRRSLGKWLLGAELVSSSGARPPRWRLALRGIMAALLYVIPPLVVLALLSPHVQGVHDQVARIVVVRRGPDAPDADAKDR